MEVVVATAFVAVVTLVVVMMFGDNNFRQQFVNDKVRIKLFPILTTWILGCCLVDYFVECVV